MAEFNMENQRNCRMCGLQLPPINRYDTEWCWICWRRTWEKEYDRYYVRIKTSNNLILFEEVQSLRGVNPFQEKNKSLIQTEMKNEREKLTKKNE